MAENTEEALREHLKQLHDELERTATITPEERDRVGQMMTDVIESVGEQPSPMERYHRVQEGLRDQAREFESRHPRLAGVIERIADLLAGAGI